MLFRQVICAVAFFGGVSSFLSCGLPAEVPAGHKTENVIVVMIDGMRWQEVFRGADLELLKTLRICNKITSDNNLP
jgi:hypothetical protein